MNDAAVLSDVFPDQLFEVLPAQLVAVPSLSCQLLFHSPLGGDPGMVGAGEPQGRVPQHAVPAYQGVFNCFLQGVAKVQLAGDVGRRHDNGKGFLAGVGVGREVAFRKPILVQPLLNCSGVIGPRNFGR